MGEKIRKLTRCCEVGVAEKSGTSQDYAQARSRTPTPQDHAQARPWMITSQVECECLRWRKRDGLHRCGASDPSSAVSPSSVSSVAHIPTRPASQSIARPAFIFFERLRQRMHHPGCRTSFRQLDDPLIFYQFSVRLILRHLACRLLFRHVSRLREERLELRTARLLPHERAYDHERE